MTVQCTCSPSTFENSLITGHLLFQFFVFFFHMFFFFILAHCLVVTMLFAFLRGMPLGVDAKVAGLKTKRLENVSVNVMA